MVNCVVVVGTRSINVTGMASSPKLVARITLSVANFTKAAKKVAPSKVKAMLDSIGSIDCGQNRAKDRIIIHVSSRK